ncbi:LOW QUALITY PROTEIN: hypothetical protein LZ30DRAFT_748285 [Colletotrichum cereale]|nr:LOW QUALITY PROTEIN: hypothetical protein LZ30DRAFT_748285 [Colletotrichum cereale]
MSALSFWEQSRSPRPSAALILLKSWHKDFWLRWDQKRLSPEETIGLYGLATFFWLHPLFFNGYKKVLAVQTLFALDRDTSAEAMRVSFSRKANIAQLQNRKHGLALELASNLAVLLLLPVAPRVALVGLVFYSKLSANNGYELIGATVLIYTGIPLATALNWYYQERFLRMARALATAVYGKTIQSKVSASDDSAALTLMSADIERIRMGFMQLHELWANPIQVALACWLLHRQLGAAFAASIILVGICIASSTILMKCLGPLQVAWMQAIQKRVVGNMKNIKISGLAVPAIQELRMSGVKFKLFLVGSVGIRFTPILLAPVLTLAATPRTLEVTTIFTSIAYLLLLSEPLTTLFQVAPQLLAGLACLQRESRHDFRDYTKAISLEKPDPSSPAFKIINGSFGRDKESLVLRNINALIPQGFTVASGPVTSGKSTLCKALLGGTPIVEGDIITGINPRTVGYCDQTPFLWNASIEDSIVGFSYMTVIEATMLGSDFLELPRGDITTVGSNGISLGGGQKQRVSLARALYQQYDLLIVDDVLSGLDVDTEEHVFHRVFETAGLLKERDTTTVLCTHTTRHLYYSDYIIVLVADGTVSEQGSFEQLGRSKPDASTNPTRIMGDAAVLGHYWQSIGVLWMLSFIVFSILCGFLHNFPTVWLRYWSEDISSPDPDRSQSFYVGLYALFQSSALVGIAAVVATSSPYIVIVYPFIVCLLYFIQRFYLRTSRQLRLLDLEAKIPLYTGFLDTIIGVATLRAFGWTDDSIQINNTLLDTSQKPAYLLSMVVAVLAVFVVTLSTQLRSNAGFTGPSLVSLMTFGKTLANLVQLYTLLGTSTGAVGRLKSLSDNTSREDLKGENKSMSAAWPEKGRVVVEGHSASYSESQPLSENETGNCGSPRMRDLALRELTLTIEPGEKVAFCGRTGSVHQDAVFPPDRTSFKKNLDPFCIATDEECQSVLESVRLWDLVSNLGGLEAGMNADMLSHGQKQLFSLLRAVLRRRIHTRMLPTNTGAARFASDTGSTGGTELLPIPHLSAGGVLILDDFSRRRRVEVHEIIRREFDGYTILMVTHRLDIVMGFDKAYVKDSGRVVEQGIPSELVKQENSRFKDLWTLVKGGKSRTN